MSDVWRPMTALVVVAMALGGCGPGADPVNANGTDDEPGDGEILPVVAGTVETGSISAHILASGNLEAVDIVDVNARVPGQIQELEVEEGTEVAAGDLLLRLDPRQYRIAAARAEAELEKRRADLERFERMVAEGVLPRSDYEQARYEFRQAELAWEQARMDLADTEVRAPIAGVVSHRYVHLGERVTANQRLFTIVDPSRLWVRVHVPEAELPSLQPGLPATLTTGVLAGESFAATVERISPVVDPETGTVKVTVAVDALSTALRPGMFVNVRIATESHGESLLIPKRAVIYPGEQPAVYRIEDAGGSLVVELVAVRLGDASEDRVEVLDGLAAGDRVVVLGHDALSPGSPVRIVEAAAIGLPDLGR